MVLAWDGPRRGKGSQLVLLSSPAGTWEPPLSSLQLFLPCPALLPCRPICRTETGDSSEEQIPGPTRGRPTSGSQPRPTTPGRGVRVNWEMNAGKSGETMSQDWIQAAEKVKCGGRRHGVEVGNLTVGTEFRVSPILLAEPGLFECGDLLCRAWTLL